MPDDHTLDLNRAFVPTADDVVALRLARANAPSWLHADWRTIAALLPPAAADRCRTARDEWRPFSLD